MLSILEILLPVFALILAGFVCRRSGVLGPNAASELNRFVVWLALPALLFDTMARATWQQLNQPAFIAAFSIACAGAFLVILVARLASGLHLADASIDAIAAAYPNTGYIGFPLCLLAFGTSSPDADDDRHDPRRLRAVCHRHCLDRGRLANRTQPLQLHDLARRQDLERSQR